MIHHYYKSSIFRRMLAFSNSGGIFFILSQRIKTKLYTDFVRANALNYYWLKKLPSNRVHRRKTRLTWQNGDLLIHALIDLRKES
jgi:hypothetical protein